MKKVFLVTLAVVLVVGLILAGCAKEVTPTTPTTPTTPAAFEWPDTLKFITHPSTSTGYVATAAWTPVLEADTGMKVRITPMESAAARWKIFKPGDKYDLITLVSMDAVVGLEAVGGHAEKGVGSFPIRFLYRIINFPNTIIVRGDGPIKSWADVKPGFRMGYDAGSPHGLPEAKAMISWAGIDPDTDVEWIPGSDMDWVIDLLLEGKVEATTGPPTSAYTFRAAASPGGVRFLEMDPTEDPEAAARVAERMPNMVFMQVTGGVPEAVGLKTVGHVYVYGTLPEFDEELAYHMIKWLDENFEAYKEKDFRVNDMSLESLLDVLPTFYLPIHDGCIKYLEEIGVWTDQMQSSWDKSVDLTHQYRDAFTAAVASAEAKGIAVDPLNDIWLDFWENYKKELGLRKFSPWI